MSCLGLVVTEVLGFRVVIRVGCVFVFLERFLFFEG